MLELVIRRAVLLSAIFGNVPGYVASQLSMDVGFDAISHSSLLSNISVVAPVLFLVLVQIFSLENLVVSEVSVLGVTLSNLMNLKYGFHIQLFI